MNDIDWTGGLEPALDYMLSGRPDDPEMRESASIWLYEENGAFGFPRIGIEAIGKAWDKHGFQMNFAMPDGRVLMDGATEGSSHSPLGPSGKASILGTAGLSFECLEPFKKWRVHYEGSPIDTTTQAMIDQTMDAQRRSSLELDVELTMATPGWTQDLRPERLEHMTEAERIDAGLMGYGWRVEHTFRADGTLIVDGEKRAFRGVGSRIHRQSVRPLAAFRGHCWQSGLFPDGRAFALCAYPPREDGTTYNDGYVYLGGVMYPARGRLIPHMTSVIAEGEDVSLEMEYELGVARIAGRSLFNTFKVGLAEMPGFTLQQGGAKYSWDDQETYGMLERSNWEDKLES